MEKYHGNSCLQRWKLKIRIPSTSIPAGGSVSRTVTFDYYHKAAIVGAMNKQDWLIGLVGVVNNASEGISYTPGIFSLTEYKRQAITHTYFSGNEFYGTIFGEKIGFELSFANKIFTFTLKSEGSSAFNGQADVNIIAL